MQIKCTSCGATQEVLNTQNCTFCGSIINPEIHYENKSEIIFDKNDSKLTVYEKSLEYTSGQNQFLVLYKNIQSLKSSIFNPPYKVINPIYWQFFMGLGIFLLCFFFYQTMIPHTQDKSQVINGSYYFYEEKTEPSFGAFIFSTFFAMPFLFLSYYLKKAYDKSKIIFKKIVIPEGEHFVEIHITGVTPKIIKIGSTEETQKIYSILKEKIEFYKMSQE